MSVTYTIPEHISQRSLLTRWSTWYSRVSIQPCFAHSTGVIGFPYVNKAEYVCKRFRNSSRSRTMGISVPRSGVTGAALFCMSSFRLSFVPKCCSKNSFSKSFLLQSAMVGKWSVKDGHMLEWHRLSNYTYDFAVKPRSVRLLFAVGTVAPISLYTWSTKAESSSALRFRPCDAINWSQQVHLVWVYAHEVPLFENFVTSVLLCYQGCSKRRLIIKSSSSIL
jgi:hypothetical protein